MSFNQSRSDKSDAQYRKTGRSASFNPQRASSGGYGKGGGGGSGPAPQRSFKNHNTNAQGGLQPRANVPQQAPNLVSSSGPSGNTPAQRSVQNGAANTPVPSSASKPPEPLARAAVSQPATVTSDATEPVTPSKTPGDASKAFPFQFGSISPSFVNGMQIPARTSSAPPNLDEQKRNQARHGSFKPASSVPASLPKHQLPRKDGVSVDQSNNSGDVHLASKVNKDVQAVSAPSISASSMSQMQKPPLLPMTGISMQMSFPQSQVPLQFGGPAPQIQSQGVAASSIQVPMPMPIPMGNSPPVQQQIFVPGLQPHPMQPHGMMHQGQNLSFSNQMGQLPHQLSNLGFSPQYAQQQGGKFSGPRKTVKIIDPKTREEVKFERRTDTYSNGGASGPRTHHNLPPQSQPVASCQPSHQGNYYANPYNPSMYFQAPSSVPLTTSLATPNSEVPRFNYPVSQGAQGISFINPSSPHSMAASKGGNPGHGVVELPDLEHSRDAHSVLSGIPLATTKAAVKPATESHGNKVVDPSISTSLPVVEKGDSPRRPVSGSSETPLAISKDSCESLVSNLPDAGIQPVEMPSAVSAESLVSNSLPSSFTSEEYFPVMPTAEGKGRESISWSNSTKDQQNMSGMQEQIQSQHQGGGLSTTALNLPTSRSEVAKTTLAYSVATEGYSASSMESRLSDNSTGPSPPESHAFGAPKDLASLLSEDSGARSTGVPLQSSCPAELDDLLHDGKKKDETLKMEGREAGLVDSPEQVSGIAANSSSVNVPEAVKQTEQDDVLEDVATSNETMPAEIARATDEAETSTSTTLGSTDKRSPQLNTVPSVGSGDISSTLAASSSVKGNTGSIETSVTESCVSDRISTSTTDSAEVTSKDGETVEKIGGLQASGLKEKTETRKPTAARGRKKLKEILQKADAQGTTSDLYMAYKGPDENKEAVVSAQSADNTPSSIISKQAAARALRDDFKETEKVEKSKGEPDDWEDAADMSSPKLETSSNKGKVDSRSMDQEKAGNENITRKYSRDFLLTFAEHCTELPDGFRINDRADIFTSASVSSPHLIDRDSYSSPARVIDRASGGPRLDRRGSGLVGDDRWNKLPGPFGPGRDNRMDVGYGNNAGFRPGGVLRNPRGQNTSHFSGGILSGPIQNLGSQVGLQRNSSDADRWQRVANYQQRGLIPSPQTPLQMMHKAEKKYEVGRVTDEEEAKQRQLKAVLNKLTPQNFEKLFEQVKAVNIDNAGTLTGVISQIFDKALMEPTFCEMYANFCCCLAGELPDFSENNEKITFKRLLLNKCQEEFERGESEQEEANKTDEGESKMTEEEREEKRVKARRRMLGNIRLIGELYKKKMLTERIMHECIKKLLGQSQVPEEEDIEALCKLMTTIGDMIDHPIAKDHMDAYFEKMANLSNNTQLSSRVRFMLKDAIDLRKNKWQQRRKVEGPKKIEEVHRDAAQERQTQASRLARGPGMNPSARRGPSIDFGSRGPALSSPNTYMGGYRGLQPQGRGYGTQDARSEERQSFEGRILSVPLTQRPIGEDSITLGPQGGLARGMSSTRGPSSVASAPDIPSPGDSRRIGPGLNGYGSASDRMPYSQNRLTVPAAYEQSAAQERNRNYANRDVGNPDRCSDKGSPISSPMQVQPTVAPEKALPEERLHDMSMAAIKEFYSARDEKEVALCIRDLNSPSFYPSMICLWVTDSFERKEMERVLLAKLLVKLTKSRDGMLSQSQLIKGFESVLSTLEDAVNDAPRAPEFLGYMFAIVVIEDVISLRKIAQLLFEGGEELGRLREVGIAADVLGSVLEVIKSEKGDSFFDEICRSSSLRLGDFCPPGPFKSKKLEKFM